MIVDRLVIIFIEFDMMKYMLILHIITPQNAPCHLNQCQDVIRRMTQEEIQWPVLKRRLMLIGFVMEIGCG